jgi:uncharacterized membrane protein
VVCHVHEHQEGACNNVDDPYILKQPNVFLSLCMYILTCVALLHCPVKHQSSVKKKKVSQPRTTYIYIYIYNR